MAPPEREKRKSKRWWESVWHRLKEKKEKQAVVRESIAPPEREKRKVGGGRKYILQKTKQRKS